MVANIENINEIISAYVEHAYTENSGIQVRGVDYRPVVPKGSQIWAGLKNFVTSTIQ